MKHLLFAALAAFVMTLSAPLPAAAQDAPLSREQQAYVAKAEDYLRDLKTAQARFLQTAPDGNQVIGTFYLSRPGRLRFEYDEPVKDFVVADGFFIYFYDGQLKQQSNAPIGQTLADFLLRPDLRLSGDITVTDVQRRSGLLSITLVQTNEPASGSLMLGFEENPFRLKKWRVTDATNAVVEVELFKVQENVALDRSLFVYVEPKGNRPRYNQ